VKKSMDEGKSTLWGWLEALLGVVGVAGAVVTAIILGAPAAISIAVGLVLTAVAGLIGWLVGSSNSVDTSIEQVKNTSKRSFGEVSNQIAQTTDQVEELTQKTLGKSPGLIPAIRQVGTESHVAFSSMRRDQLAASDSTDSLWRRLGFTVAALDGVIERTPEAVEAIQKINKELAEGKKDQDLQERTDQVNKVARGIKPLNFRGLPDTERQVSLQDCFVEDFKSRGERASIAMAEGFERGQEKSIPIIRETMHRMTMEVALYLPSSDAEKGPLSNLQERGEGLLSTLVRGMELYTPEMYKKVEGVLQPISDLYQSVLLEERGKGGAEVKVGTQPSGIAGPIVEAIDRQTNRILAHLDETLMLWQEIDLSDLQVRAKLTTLE